MLNGVMKAYALQLQESDFPVDAPAISGHGSIGAYDAVAWNDDGDGVVAHRTADGLGRPATNTAGDVAIGHLTAIGYFQKLLPDSLAESASLHPQGWSEMGYVAIEVDIEPLACLTEYWQVGPFLKCLVLLVGRRSPAIKPETDKRYAV